MTPTEKEKLEGFGDAVCVLVIIALGVFSMLSLIWVMADMVFFYAGCSILKDFCF